MNNSDWLAEQFEVKRAHLRSVAYRMLGSLIEADDAVQEAWLRLNRADTSAVENLGGWLTTVTARVCLDMLRARAARREEPLEEYTPGVMAHQESERDPEHAALLADSVGVALLVILETLSPTERLAFVLHDMFAVPFETIAPIVGRSPTATRQLASRARRRVRGAETVSNSDYTRQRAIVDAFLAAARDGNFGALLALLAPDVVFRADAAAVSLGGPAEVRGAPAVAKQFSGRAQAARAVLLNGAVGIAVVPGDRLLLVLELTLVDGLITAISAVADPAQLQQIEPIMLDE